MTRLAWLGLFRSLWWEARKVWRTRKHGGCIALSEDPRRHGASRRAFAAGKALVVRGCDERGTSAPSRPVAVLVRVECHFPHERRKNDSSAPRMLNAFRDRRHKLG